MRRVRNMVALALVVQIILAATTFKIGVHRCGGNIQHIAILSKARGCIHAERSATNEFSRKNTCCQDILIGHSGQIFESSASNEIVPEACVLMHQAPHIVMCRILPHACADTLFRRYVPPLLFKNISLINRVILI